MAEGGGGFSPKAGTPRRVGPPTRRVGSPARRVGSPLTTLVGLSAVAAVTNLNLNPNSSRPNLNPNVNPSHPNPNPNPSLSRSPNQSGFAVHVWCMLRFFDYGRHMPLTLTPHPDPNPY